MDCRIYVRGEIDLATVPELDLRLHHVIDTSPAHLVVDCHEVTFDDSTGVRALVNARKKLGARHRSLTVVNASPFVARVLEILGLTEMLGDAADHASVG